MKNLRVRRITRPVREAGYIDSLPETVQQLGYDGLFGFVVCDEETVPQHVVISAASLGDTGGWKSKFANWIN